MAYQSGGGGGGHGALSLIQEIKTAGSQATVDFTGIPATFNSLQLVGTACSALASGTTDPLNLTLNGVSTADYYCSRLKQVDTTAVGEVAFADTAGRLGSVQAVGANTFGSSVELLVPNYRASLAAVLLSWKLGTWNGTSAVLFVGDGLLNNALVVSRLTLSLGTGPFLDGHSLRLYGIT